MDNKIAYIVKGFPRLSETFISNEILMLEKMGTDMQLFSVKRPSEELEHHIVSEIRSELEYLPSMTSLSKTWLLAWLWQNLPFYWRSHIRLARQQPFRYLRTLTSVLAMSLRYRESFFSKPKKVFVKEFIQAGYIARQIEDSGQIRHCHAHFCHGATTIAMFVSRLTGLPFSFTAHAKDIYQENQNPGNLLNLKIQASSFVATCTGANETYLKWLGRETKIHKIYHGIDVNFFRPEDRPYRRPDPVILAIGRFVEKKGFDRLIEACAILRNKGTRFNCRIIGERGDQYPVLLRQITSLGLVGYMTLEGPRAHEELLPIYQQSTLFVLPCQIVKDGDRDGIPNVLVEAMACGLPVVSTEISGIPELIENEKNGLLVKPQDTESLAVAMERLLSNTMLASRLSSNARKTVCERFDSAKTTLQLQNLLNSSIASSVTKTADREVIRAHS